MAATGGEEIAGDFGLGEEVLAVLPTDPFEQLDVARKITSIALATRVSKLESESSRLRQALEDREDLIAELSARVETLDASLADVSRQLSRAKQEKESLMSENASLAGTVKKLNRDVSKLEIFRKTLMQSLQEEEDGSGGVQRVLAQQTADAASHSTGSLLGDEDADLPALKLSAVKTQLSESGISVSERNASNFAASKESISRSISVASHCSTPSLTPPLSPPRLSATRSPTRLSNPASPRRHSISFSSARNMFDERSSIYSSMPSSIQSTTAPPSDAETQTGRTRVDGKEFFRQVRSRLSFEQFSAFLANVRELNSHKQTREETLRKADAIFGSENKDLYAIFEGLITRNLH